MNKKKQKNFIPLSGWDRVLLHLPDPEAARLASADETADVRARRRVGRDLAPMRRWGWRGGVVPGPGGALPAKERGEQGQDQGFQRGARAHGRGGAAQVSLGVLRPGGLWGRAAGKGFI